MVFVGGGSRRWSKGDGGGGRWSKRGGCGRYSLVHEYVVECS